MTKEERNTYWGPKVLESALGKGQTQANHRRHDVRKKKKSRIKTIE
jgi:hypothetical protein